ncbi:MAG: hypothetical protein JO370_15250, partial [Paucibacter sp.]|nr:hypothetical protein [Roseateles sp.]
MSQYGRFIPREELQNFAAWSPDALQGVGERPEPMPRTGPAAGKPVLPGATNFGASAAHAPSPAAAEPPPPPAPDIEALVKSARQSGYQDGYRD